MTPDQRIECVRDLLEDMQAYPARFGTMSSSERLIVAIVMDRVDLLRGEGINSLVEAQDRIGPEWVTAIRAVTAR